MKTNVRVATNTPVPACVLVLQPKLSLKGETNKIPNNSTAARIAMKRKIEPDLAIKAHYNRKMYVPSSLAVGWSNSVRGRTESNERKKRCLKADGAKEGVMSASLKGTQGEERGS